MPAVLVEVGSFSNKDEEKKLASDTFQATIAGALYRLSPRSFPNTPARPCQRPVELGDRAVAGSDE